MKKTILYGGIIFLFISCNNEKAENTTPTASATDSLPAKEKQLKDDIKKYPDSMLIKESLIQYYEDNADYDKALTAYKANKKARDDAWARWKKLLAGI